MSYKKLKKFQKIFNRDDFNYISSVDNIDTVSGIILFNISTPDSKETAYITFLEKFLGNINSFYIWVNAKTIPDIKKGYLFCQRELVRCINLLRESDYKRESISRNYTKKFNKVFLYGLSRLYNGIRAAFDPNILGTTKINQGQLVQYILDKSEGVGRKCLFNTIGKNAFAKKIYEMNLQELIIIERLLLRPSNNQIRTYNGWRDLGIGHTAVRILSKHRGMRKDTIFFLYRISEHKDYERQLATPPDKVKFLAA